MTPIKLLADCFALPVLPLKNPYFFGFALTITLQRSASAQAVEAALASDTKRAAVLAQKEANNDDPRPCQCPRTVEKDAGKEGQVKGLTPLAEVGCRDNMKQADAV
jgi:ATP-dependent Lon protease